MEVFTMDGVRYDVHVTELRRSFSIPDTEQAGRTQDGRMYREPIGTFYNYTMTVSRNGANDEAMDALWEAISQPVDSHICSFPYGQKMLTQRMYVTSGQQNIQLINCSGNHWGDITVDFVAMEPKVMA